MFFLADAAISLWDSKYHYNIGRPVTIIRDVVPGCEGMHQDLAPMFDYVPLGAPNSNNTGPNFTPPFPTYPSGHAGFGGALFEIIRLFYGTDQIKFSFISDEFNGQTRDNEGNVRPVVERFYENLSEAEEENGKSRIYLGIHWPIDSTEGIKQGNKIANFVFSHIPYNKLC